MSDNTVSTDAIVIERIFDAPVDLIWQLWTQPEHFKNWYGPEGFAVPVAELDVRVGGKRLVCMESADGSMTFWTTGEYTEVTPTTRLVYTDSFADEKGNLVPPSAYGMQDDEHPAMTEVTVQFESLGDRTKMVMTHAGLPADSGGNEGWKQSFDKLATYAESVRSS